MNRICPGKRSGNTSQQFMYYFLKRVVSRFDCLIDLHTASFGRLNSLYVRADLNDKDTYRVAMQQNSEIVVHNTGPDGSLRGAATDMKIPAITVEIGQPQLFHATFIERVVLGITATLHTYGIVTTADPAVESADFKDPVVCTKSFWIFTPTGGVLYVLPRCGDWVRKGSVLANIHNIFGQRIARVTAPATGVIVGRNANPGSCRRCCCCCCCTWRLFLTRVCHSTSLSVCVPFFFGGQWRKVATGWCTLASLVGRLRPWFTTDTNRCFPNSQTTVAIDHPFHTSR